VRVNGRKRPNSEHRVHRGSKSVLDLLCPLSRCCHLFLICEFLFSSVGFSDEVVVVVVVLE
jgi:hypothetical protein